MNIAILTLFPEMVREALSASIVKRAQEKNLVTIEYINFRDFANDNYKTVDDHPYGGGHGMILRVDIVDRTIESAKAKAKEKTATILLDPQGTPYTQSTAQTLTAYNNLILVCGHYEGVDERIRNLVDMELSLGDFVLTGGEIPAMAIADSVIRLLPGVLAKKEATKEESFATGVLEHPQYTRPAEYRGMKVPDVLVSGNHKDIAAWRKKEAHARTKRRRPDLLSSAKTDQA